MRTAYVVIVVLALFLVSACGQKANDPSDAEAIVNLNESYTEAFSSQDLEGVSSFFTDGAVILVPNQPQAAGKDAIRALYQESFDSYSSTRLNSPIEEVVSSGDQASARGTFTLSATPEASGLSPINEQGKWMAAFQRQGDGSWKCSQLIWNSDQPTPGATADGADEEALLQVERDWLNAVVNKDKAALENILADNFISNGEEGVRNKKQTIAADTSNAFKLDSAEHSNLQPMVFGDTAIVYGMTAAKGTEKGKEFSGIYRWTDIFEKRDGRWQCVIAYGTAVE